MLVLTRKIGDEIIIGGNIRVKIVSVKGDRIRIGIDAPTEVTVNRAEIQERKNVSRKTPVPAAVCEESVDLGASCSLASHDTVRH
jgi:carbon storage regulator CsrA